MNTLCTQRERMSDKSMREGNGVIRSPGCHDASKLHRVWSAFSLMSKNPRGHSELKRLITRLSDSFQRSVSYDGSCTQHAPSCTLSPLSVSSFLLLYVFVWKIEYDLCSNW